MKAIKILTILTIALFFSNCSKGQNAETISVTDFESKLNAVENAQLLDVRTVGEYTEGHLDKAKNIDWNGNSFESEVQKLDKSKPVFVYCLVGGRSKKAADKLKDMGFTTVYNMDGGYMKWSEAHPKMQKKEDAGMTKADYDKLIASDKVVVIDFYAEWCGPCKKMTPYLTKMEKEYQGKAKIIRVDADKNKALFNELGYQALPVVLVFKDGKEVWKKNGFVSEAELKSQL
ncbi:Thioredoxin family protein [Flavobacterium enshiense DK69]|uniref:Thioredoxin n=1 Tax=Flavobacterium enshiense DK69 TaxID=1107311 RepID=V6S7M1_9FLAO|nr:thioredoxin domain-containing protein [Flavobacterium enshiense]ESU22257.1 Thioredoxin family protein [Flavobacterium enshiense DK69]KGO97268.1 thioredoxin [Flavobacterium enshiense DK69]